MDRKAKWVSSTVLVAAAALAVAEHCYIQGPLVDCVQCTNETPGPLCGGQPCDDTVDAEIDVTTLVEAPDGTLGRDPKTSPGGSCDRT